MSTTLQADQKKPVEAPVAMTVEGVASYKPRASRYEIKDAIVPGLRLVIQTNGKKSWALRFNQGGEYRKITFGPWPLVPLAEDAADKKARVARDPASIPPDARGLARHWLGLKATGVDIAEEWDRQHKAAPVLASDEAEKFMVRNRWQQFMDKPTKKGRAKRASSRKRFEGLFAPLLAKWGDRDVRAVSKVDCEDAITVASKRGDHAGASMWMLLNGFFGWLEKKGVIDKSPMKTIEKLVAASDCERVLIDEELKIVWRAGDQQSVFGGLVQMLLLTGQRRTEVASMKFSEINFDKKEWELPGDKTKNGLPHIVFLSDAAMRIIERAPRIVGCDFVFTTDGRTHLSGFSKGKTAFDKIAPTSTPWTLHDLRRTFMTRLVADLKIPEVVAHKILNHGDAFGSKSKLGKIYNKYQYADERRAAMNAWTVKLDRIINPDAASNVVPMRTPEAVA
jgi:integrase